MVAVYYSDDDAAAPKPPVGVGLNRPCKVVLTGALSACADLKYACEGYCNHTHPWLLPPYPPSFFLLFVAMLDVQHMLLTQ